MLACARPLPIMPPFANPDAKGNEAMTDTPSVGIIMGSQSDWSVMRACADMLESFGVAHEVRIISAHRTPKRLDHYCADAKERGLKVIIAAAGMAAALPGAAAALTPLPILGVPMKGDLMGGLDALLAMVQMPGGIPVGTLAVGKAGAKNAAILAVSILALSDDSLARKLDIFRTEQTAGVPETPRDD